MESNATTKFLDFLAAKSDMTEVTLWNHRKRNAINPKMILMVSKTSGNLPYLFVGNHKLVLTTNYQRKNYVNIMLVLRL